MKYRTFAAALMSTLATTTVAYALPEAEKIYRKARSFYSSGDLRAEKKAYQQLQQEKYATLRSRETIDGDPLTYRDLARMRLPKIECSLKYESGKKSKAPRSSDETIRQVLKAMSAKDKEKLITLMSCEILEGVPESEYDSTSREIAARHLLGELSRDGYGSISANAQPYHLLPGLHEGYYVISNGEDKVGFQIKANRVAAILWGSPTD